MSVTLEELIELQGSHIVFNQRPTSFQTVRLD